MNSSDVSVIVATFNRSQKLLHCLDCLDKQTVHGFEVIVVNDGSTDSTADVLRSYNPKNFSFRGVNKHNDGRSLSRNRGAAEARGSILIFFDDDMRPFPECIAEHLSLMETDGECISVGTQEDDLSQAKNDFDRFRCYIGKGWERVLEHPQEDRPPYLTAANFCIRKNTFNQLNGFDKLMEVAEDFELGIRANEMGLKVKYNAKARGWHDSWIGCDSFIRREVEYYRSFLTVAAKHPAVTMGAPAVYRPGPGKKLAFNILSRRFFVPLVDRNFFTFVPRALRYKFYDVLITGLSKVYPARFTLQQPRNHGR